MAGKLAFRSRGLAGKSNTPCRRAIASTMLVALVAGCIPVYVEPTGKDIATWRVHNDSLLPLVLLTFEDPESCSGKRKMNGGKEQQPYGTTLEVPIKAGERFHFRLTGISGGYSSGLMRTWHQCSFAGSFETVRGGIYVTWFESQGVKCWLRVAEQVSEKDGEPVYRRLASFKQEPKCNLKAPGQ
jgi:hypothetical protein